MVTALLITGTVLIGTFLIVETLNALLDGTSILLIP